METRESYSVEREMTSRWLMYTGWVKISLFLTVVVFAILGAAPLPAGEPQFEAASVRRTDRCNMENFVDPEMIRLSGDPLKVVLGEAFRVKLDQIIGPSWLDADCFVIIAKIPEGATKDRLPAMLQALLVERFKLAVHNESRRRPGYAIVVDKNGPKFKESDPSSPDARAHAGQVRFGGVSGAFGIKGAMTMASLAHFVSIRLGVPVQDLTELKGTYDIDVSWVPDRALERSGQYADGATHQSSVDPEIGVPTTDIFAAFRESLGLKLERNKQQVEVIVVDHIERVPTAN
jgi:uncharacterized protein (TIGR03435 family)